MADAAADGGLWGSLSKMLGIQGNQMNSATMQQMSSQASAPAAAPEPPPTGPNNPQVVPAPPQKVQLTQQPTTQPPGTLPQEIQPSQPALAGPSAPSVPTATNGPGGTDIGWMKAYLLGQSPTRSPELEKQMATADQNAKDSLSRQNDALSQQKALAQQYTDAPRRTDYRALAAGLDSLTGSNIYQAANAAAPESPEKKLETQIAQAKGITDATGSLTKDQLDYIKQKLQQQSYIENRTTKENIAKNADLTKLATAGNTQGNQATRIGTQQDRLAQSAVKDLHSSPPIVKAVEQSNQMSIDKHTLATADKIPPQMLMEVQKGIANAVSGGKSAAVADTESMRMSNLETEYATFMQKVSSGVVDVNAPEMKAYLSSVIDRLDQGYKNIAYSRAQQLLKSDASTYSHTPSAIKARAEAAETYRPDSPAFGGMITISNGKETLKIPRTDLKHAQADDPSFKEVP